MDLRVIILVHLRWHFGCLSGFARLSGQPGFERLPRPNPSFPLSLRPETSSPMMPERRVRLTMQWIVPRGEMGVGSALSALLSETRVQPGCLNCVLPTEMGARAGSNCMEEWRSKQDLVAELRSMRFTQLAQLLESALECPRVEFSLPGGIRGIGQAEEALGNLGEPS